MKTKKAKVGDRIRLLYGATGEERGKIIMVIKHRPTYLVEWDNGGKRRLFEYEFEVEK